MIERLYYVNERGDKVELSTLSRYHVNISKDVSGLSDINNKLYTINSMGQDGDTYIGNRIEARDIEIVGHLKARDKTAQQVLRRQLNHILNPQYMAQFVYEYGDFKRVIDCKIESAPVYKPSTVYPEFTIQLVCLNPFWHEESDTREDIAIWEGGFEFELELDENWEIGNRQPSLIVDVYNSGDVKSGMKIYFRALGTVVNPLLLNVDTLEYIKINYTMAAGDVLIVTTGYGEKGISLLSGGVTTDAFRYLDPDSTHLQLDVGDNLFRYDAQSDVDNLEVSIYHKNYYLGV